MFQVVVGIKVQVLVSVRGLAVDGDLGATVVIDMDASVQKG